MISLDVVSLFTNIPHELLSKGIEKRYHLIMQQYDIPLNELLNTVKFLMDNTFFHNTFFQYDGKFYQQTHGSPMGSPISPIFADIVMTDLEEECLNNLDFKPLIYKRYVDDTILCIPCNELDPVLEVFNNYHPRLQFIHEVELQGKINFLEVSLIRNDNHLITDWFRKSTFSGRFLHFSSNHPIEQKRAMVYTLVDKAILLADVGFHQKNLNIVKNFLIDNGYPEKFINFNIEKRLNKICFPGNSDININNNTRFAGTLIYLLYQSFLRKLRII